MGDDDEEHGNAAEERKGIEQLQSEQFRKQEQLDRLRGRIRALEEELSTREVELSDVQRRCESERQLGTKRVPGEDRARAANAEDEFLRNEVQRMLQERVPAMAPVEEEGEEEGVNFDKATGPKQEGDPAKAAQLHDTVLVSYVQMSEGRQEDYKVSYRIDSHTTVEQLHRDACAYWGCSRKDYSLWKLDTDDKPARLFKAPKPGEQVPPKLLQDVDVLNPAEQAHLHLCRDSAEILKARQRERERERKEGERKSQPETQGAEHRKSYDVLKTLKHGLGYAVNEKQPEEFVDAFRPWPGIYNLLARRDRGTRSKQKWQYVFFSDILSYSLLILLSSLCIYFRHDMNHYLLREGVFQTLVSGLPGESLLRDTKELLVPLDGLPPGAGAYEALTPGMAWRLDEGNSLGSLVANASYEGVQVARSTLGLDPLLSQVVISGRWRPPEANGTCPSVLVYLAPRPVSGGGPFQLGWSCDEVTGRADNTTAVSQDTPCTDFGANGGSFTLTLDNSGTTRLEAANGACRFSVSQANAAWDDLMVKGQLRYLFFEMEAGGELQDVTTTGQTPRATPDFRDIKNWNQLLDYIMGPFAYQLYWPLSTLRRFYTLASALRFRQQMAQNKACIRTRLPLNLQRTCGHELVDSEEKEERGELPPLPGSSLLPRSSLVWADNPTGAVGFYGDVQRYYRSSGYVFDVPVRNITPANIGITENRSRAAVSPAWITTRTRLFSIEMLLANKHLGGHVVVQLNLEVPPSGAMNPQVLLIPIRLGDSYHDEVARALDIVRFILVITVVLGVRVWRETKQKVGEGLSGMAYVLSIEGLLDMCTAATFLAVQYVRLRGRPPQPSSELMDTFRSYSHVARNLQQLDILEAVFLLLLVIRFATFGRLFSVIFRFFRTYKASLVLFSYYLLIFAPIFLSTTFLASATYAPQLKAFSTFLESLATMLFAVKESYRVEQLLLKSSWTIPFLTWFFLSTLAFVIHGFLAIIVHTYFEVHLVDGSDPNEEKWSWDDWVRWMLWKPVYNRLLGKMGATGDKGDEGDTSSDEDSSSDEEERR